MKIHGSYLLPSSQIVSNRAILFLPIRSISELFSFLDHPKAIISEDFFVLSFQIQTPIILYSCPFVRLNILLVLRSSILQSVRDLFVLLHQIPSSIFVLLILPGDSSSFVSHFRILTAVLSRFFSLIIILIRSFFPILTVVH